MPRPAIHRFVDCSVVAEKAALVADIGPLAGWYEWTGQPRRPTRTLRQNAFFHGVQVKLLSDFLKAQDYENCDPAYSKAIIKEKFLRVPLYHPRTGAVATYVTRSTADLDVDEFSDLLDRTSHWLTDRFGILVPPADPGCHEGRGATAAG